MSSKSANRLWKAFMSAVWRRLFPELVENVVGRVVAAAGVVGALEVEEEEEDEVSVEVCVRVE